MPNNATYIYRYLMSAGLTREGTLGLMGNLYAESGLNPMNLENAYEAKLGFDDDQYVKAIDDGAYTLEQMMNDHAGIGIAQWTYSTRKKAL